MTQNYIKYSANQLNKIGNTIVYFINKIPNISKIKLLKLLYILDELSIKKSGIPCLNLTYKVWKFGPVAEEIFIELSEEPTLLKGFFKSVNNNQFKAISNFEDGEFTDNDIDLMNMIVDEFGSKTDEELVAYTHRNNTPWHIVAKNNNVLSLLETEKINNTEFQVDLKLLIQHDQRKTALYENYITYN